MNVGALNQSSTINYLNPKNRPKEIQYRVDRAFNDIAGCSEGSWMLFNGKKDYNLCKIKEKALLKKMIKEAPGQKEFYVLDIGAGNFEWGDSMAEYINSVTDLPEDI